MGVDVYIAEKEGTGVDADGAVDEIVAALHLLEQPHCLLVVLHLLTLHADYILNYKNYKSNQVGTFEEGRVKNGGRVGLDGWWL